MIILDTANIRKALKKAGSTYENQIGRQSPHQKKGAPARSEAEGRRGCRGKAPRGGGACGRRGRSVGALARRGRRSPRTEGAERSSAERRKRRSRGWLVQPGAETFRARQLRSGEPAGQGRSAPEHECPGAENPQARGGAPLGAGAAKILRPKGDNLPTKSEGEKGRAKSST